MSRDPAFQSWLNTPSSTFPQGESLPPSSVFFQFSGKTEVVTSTLDGHSRHGHHPPCIAVLPLVQKNVHRLLTCKEREKKAIKCNAEGKTLFLCRSVTFDLCYKRTLNERAVAVYVTPCANRPAQP